MRFGCSESLHAPFMAHDDAWQVASAAAGPPGGGAGASGGASEASKISTEKVRMHAGCTTDGLLCSELAQAEDHLR